MITAGNDDSRLVAWERRAEIPLLLLASAFLVAYAWPILDPGLPRNIESTLNVIGWTVWAAFAVDFVIRLALASQRGRYLTRHWYDVALIVLPMLRPLRLLRVLAFARILARSSRNGLAVRVSVYVIGAAVASVGLGALAVLDAEAGAADANISNFGDALWWACTTVTTVGYGDYFPVTLTGRAVAVVLMVVGIAVVSALTASVATWLISHLAQSEVEAAEDRSSAR